MKDFVYNGGARIIYGADQMQTVTQEIAKLGQRLLIVPTGSFVASGHYEAPETCLKAAGLTVFCLPAGKKSLLRKANEGIRLCTQEQIKVMLGIGCGVSMDLAKAIAFGALHADTPLEKYLTYELSTEGLAQLPVVTIPTNPMSGSETNADIQLTLDGSGLQVGCPVGNAVFTWLNPDYAMFLPRRILAYGQMTAFVQLSINYLNLSRDIVNIS